MKKLIALAFLLLPAGLMADTGDIPLSSNFQQNSGRPLDSKIVAADSTAREAISGTLRYLGMIVYQRSDNTTWQLWGDTNTWVQMPTTPNNDPYGGGIDSTEGIKPVGVVGVQRIWADSTTHTTHVIPNNGEDYVFIMSSATSVTTGNLAKWNAYGKLLDGGKDVGVMVPSTFTWQIPYALTISTALTITGASTTITAPLTVIGFTTQTISNAYFDLSQSSTSLGFIKLSNGYGTSGQVIQSGGNTSSATWVTPTAGGGGGASTLAVGTGTISGVVVASSPTAILNLDRTYFSSKLTGGSTNFISFAPGISDKGVYFSSALATVGSSNLQYDYTVGALKSIAQTTSSAAYVAVVPVSGPATSQKVIDISISGFSTPNYTLAHQNSGSGTDDSLQIWDSNQSVLGSFISTKGFRTDSGITISSGVTVTIPSVITATSTITSSMTVVIASCTTRGASPNAWITMYLGSANNSGETHMFYNVGADSCTIRIQAQPSELIESSGTLFLYAQTQRASIMALGNGLWGAGLGGIQYTPAQIATTQDDVGTFTVATASDVYECPVYLPVPCGFMGVRLGRSTGAGLVGTALTDMNGRYVVGVSSMVTASGMANYMTGGVSQIPPGPYRAEVVIPNTVTTINGSNSVGSSKAFCSKVGSSTSGADLSAFVPTLPGTGDTRTYPAFNILCSGGMQSY